MTQEERNERLWQAALAAMTGLCADHNYYPAPTKTALDCLRLAGGMVAEYERETGGGK